MTFESKATVNILESFFYCLLSKYLLQVLIRVCSDFLLIISFDLICNMTTLLNLFGPFPPPKGFRNLKDLKSDKRVDRYAFEHLCHILLEGGVKEIFII